MEIMKLISDPAVAQEILGRNMPTESIDETLVLINERMRLHHDQAITQ